MTARRVCSAFIRKNFDALKALCERLREISGNENKYAPAKLQKPKIKPKMLDDTAKRLCFKA